MPNELTPVNVFHIGKGNILVVFAGIFEIEGGARQEDKIAIGVLGNGCRAQTDQGSFGRPPRSIEQIETRATNRLQA